jgi:hypothetical protein
MRMRILRACFRRGWRGATSRALEQAGPFFGIDQAGVNLRCAESIDASDDYCAPNSAVVPDYHLYRYLPFASYVSSPARRGS